MRRSPAKLDRSSSETIERRSGSSAAGNPARDRRRARIQINLDPGRSIPDLRGRLTGRTRYVWQAARATASSSRSPTRSSSNGRMQFVREGAAEAGRDPAEIVVHCAILSYVSDDLAEARDSSAAGIPAHGGATTSPTCCGSTTPPEIHTGHAQTTSRSTAPTTTTASTTEQGTEHSAPTCPTRSSTGSASSATTEARRRELRAPSARSASARSTSTRTSPGSSPWFKKPTDARSCPPSARPCRRRPGGPLGAAALLHDHARLHERLDLLAGESSLGEDLAAPGAEPGEASGLRRACERT